MEKSTRLVDVEPLKFKDDAVAAFRKYKILREKQSESQLEVLLHRWR